MEEQPKKISIKDLPVRERPRERLLEGGGHGLSDIELLAIILRSGGKGKSVLDLSREILIRFGNFRRLSNTTIAELTMIQGIGITKAVEIKACLEIARRFSREDLTPGQKFGGSNEVFKHFHELLRDEKKELFFSVLLDNKNRVIRKDLVSIGSLSISIVHPREVFVSAIRESAGSIILVHNHPSGDPTPSHEDVEITHRLKEVGQVVGIEVLDHIIVGNGRYTSFVEKQLI